MNTKVVGFDQLFRNPPSKPSNVQVDEGLFQAKLILKAITTSSLIPKSKNCHWGKYKMKYLTSPNMTISFCHSTEEVYSTKCIYCVSLTCCNVKLTINSCFFGQAKKIACMLFKGKNSVNTGGNISNFS